MKYKWKVDAEPTGRYRSFANRMWPGAEYVNGSTAAQIHCKEDPSYESSKAKSGEHGELEIWVADHSVTPWEWRTLKKKASTLYAAKVILAQFLTTHPEFMPKEKVEEEEKQKIFNTTSDFAFSLKCQEAKKGDIIRLVLPVFPGSNEPEKVLAEVEKR